MKLMAIFFLLSVNYCYPYCVKWTRSKCIGNEIKYFCSMSLNKTIHKEVCEQRDVEHMSTSPFATENYVRPVRIPNEEKISVSDSESTTSDNNVEELYVIDGKSFYEILTEGTSTSGDVKKEYETVIVQEIRAKKVTNRCPKNELEEHNCDIYKNLPHIICNNDKDCLEKEVCCEDDCFRKKICKTPVLDTPQKKCPEFTRLQPHLRNCLRILQNKQVCTEDDQCSTNQICCEDTCLLNEGGKICITEEFI